MQYARFLCPTVPFLVALLAALGCSEGGTIAQNADAAVEPHGDAAADAHADADAVPNPDAGQDAGSEDGGLVEAAYFVSPDGDDEGPGTLERPWRTIGHAARTLAPGETVYVRAGTYRERVVVSVSGTPGAPITIAAFPGEQPIIDGEGVEIPEGWGGLFHIADQAHLRIRGVRVQNAGPGENHAGILVERSSFVTLEHCSTFACGPSRGRLSPAPRLSGCGCGLSLWSAVRRLRRGAPATGRRNGSWCLRAAGSGSWPSNAPVGVADTTR